MSRRDAAPLEDTSRAADPLFDGPGPARAALRAADWENSALGPIAQWAHDLRRAAHTVVRSPVPMLLWWGEHYIQVHNDALIASLGGDDPAVARAAKQGWPERWEVLRPLATEVVTTGEVVHIEDLVLPVDGNPSTYWTMALAPLHDDEVAPGRVAGVLAAAVDLTARVTAHELERRSADATTANLQVALASNRRIGTAVGILMAHRRITEPAAFDLLRESSQRSHRKLRDIAEDVVLTGTLPD